QLNGQSIVCRCTEDHNDRPNERARHSGIQYGTRSIPVTNVTPETTSPESLLSLVTKRSVLAAEAQANWIASAGRMRSRLRMSPYRWAASRLKVTNSTEPPEKNLR